jgi:holin-like protein
MIKALFFIFGFLLAGELIRYIFNIPVAGNIIGMLLIFLALRLKWIKLEDVKPASDKLIKYLILFFIPYGVGLMVYYNIIQGHLIPISIAVVISTIISFYITGVIMEKFGK